MTWTILCGNAKSVRRRLNATTIHKHFTQARTHTHNLPTRWNWAIKVAFNTSGTYKTEPLWGVRQITYFRVTLMSPKKKVTWLGTTVSKSSPLFALILSQLTVRNVARYNAPPSFANTSLEGSTGRNWVTRYTIDQHFVISLTNSPTLTA